MMDIAINFILFTIPFLVYGCIFGLEKELEVRQLNFRPRGLGFLLGSLAIAFFLCCLAVVAMVCYVHRVLA